MKATKENIHDLINKWHKGDSNQERHEFLGLILEEYKHGVETDEYPLSNSLK